MPEPVMRFDDPATWPSRWIDRCEIIAADMEWAAKDGGLPYKRSAMQIFNSSPTGELFQVHDWFIQCIMRREFDVRTAAGESSAEVDADLSARALCDYERLEREFMNGIALMMVAPRDVSAPHA